MESVFFHFCAIAHRATPLIDLMCDHVHKNAKWQSKNKTSEPVASTKPHALHCLNRSLPRPPLHSIGSTLPKPRHSEALKWWIQSAMTYFLSVIHTSFLSFSPRFSFLRITMALSQSPMDVAFEELAEWELRILPKVMFFHQVLNCMENLIWCLEIFIYTYMYVLHGNLILHMYIYIGNI